MKKTRCSSFFLDSFSLKKTNFLFTWWVIALLMLLTPVGAWAQQQKVTIDVKNVDVSVVFRQIKEQTKLNFVYDPDQLAGMSRVTLKVLNVSVDSALSKLFEGTTFGYRFEMQSILIKRKTANDAVKKVVVKGTVTDVQGNPLPGVAVLVKGTFVGTATDVNGNFQLAFAKGENTVLIFSFIGMKRIELPVKEGKPMLVKLEEAVSELEAVNVISTGYYDVDRRRLTSSVTSLKMDDIMQPGVQSLDMMLEGKVPGMTFMRNSGQVGAAPKIKIRGTTTLLGSTAPLWVLDGVILSDPVNVSPTQINDLDFVNLLGNAISGLNPDDIERIDVLKDASATAIYGPQASNGVIVITTKKGKIGAPSISYSTSMTYRQRPHYTDRAVNMMNSKERVDYSKEMLEKGFEVPNNESWVGYEALVYDYRAGKYNFEEFSRKAKEIETMNTDWLGLLMKNTFSHNHTVSVSGGSDNVRYYTSIGYSSDNGNLKGEQSDRYNGMANISLDYNKFHMTFGLSASVQDKNYTPEEVGLTDYAYNTARSVGAYNADGTLMFYSRGNESDVYDKPFSIINERQNSDRDIVTNNVSLSVGMKYKLLRELELTGQFSYAVSNTKEETWYGEDSWYVANKRYKYRDDHSDPKLAGTVNTILSQIPRGGELQMSQTDNKNWNARLSLIYNKALDNDQFHRLTFSVIGELGVSRYGGFQITRRGYLKDRGMLFDQFIDTGSNKYETYKNWLTGDSEALGTKSDDLSRRVGMVGTFSYSYKNSYILNANARIDGSNKFGDQSNDRLNPIWSASGRWNLHENILKDVWWIQGLAMRASFGYQGNMSASDSPELIIQHEKFHPFFEEYYSTVKYFPNPDLKWEKTRNFDIGIDFSLFKDKLTGTVEWYFRKTTDAFLNKTVSFVNGLGSYKVNKGTLQNTGFEFSLSFTPINTVGQVNGERKGFTWRFDPNFGSMINQLVSKLHGKDKVLQDKVTYADFLNGNVQMTGRAVNSFYSYKFTGLNPENGRPMFYGDDGDEIVSVGDQQMTRKEWCNIAKLEEVCLDVMERSGSREPFLQGSVTNYFGWNNWGLSFSLDYSIGAKVRMLKMYPNISSPTVATETNMRGEFVDRWRRPGDENHTTVPGILPYSDYEKTQTPWWNGKNNFAANIWEMYDNSNLRVVSGDYLKLTSMSLRYVVPESFCKMISLKSAYLSVSGTNLFTLCSKKMKGQDPSQSGSSDMINISVRPTFSMNLNVTF